MSSFATSNVFNCPLTTPEELQTTIINMISTLEQQQGRFPTFPPVLLDHFIALINLIIQQDLIHSPSYDVANNIGPLIALLLKYHILPQAHLFTSPNATVSSLDRQIYAAVLFLIKIAPALRAMTLDAALLDQISINELDLHTHAQETAQPTFQEATIWGRE